MPELQSRLNLAAREPICIFGVITPELIGQRILIKYALECQHVKMSDVNNMSVR